MSTQNNPFGVTIYATAEPEPGVVVVDPARPEIGLPVFDHVAAIFGWTREKTVTEILSVGPAAMVGLPLSDFTLGEVLVAPEAETPETESAPRYALAVANDGSALITDAEHPEEVADWAPSIASIAPEWVEGLNDGSRSRTGLRWVPSSDYTVAPVPPVEEPATASSADGTPVRVGSVTARELTDGSGFVMIEDDHPETGFFLAYEVLAEHGGTKAEALDMASKPFALLGARLSGMAIPLDVFDLVPLPETAPDPDAAPITEAEAETFTAELDELPTAVDPRAERYVGRYSGQDFVVLDTETDLVAPFGVPDDPSAEGVDDEYGWTVSAILGRARRHPENYSWIDRSEATSPLTEEPVTDAPAVPEPLADWERELLEAGDGAAAAEAPRYVFRYREDGVFGILDRELNRFAGFGLNGPLETFGETEEEFMAHAERNGFANYFYSEAPERLFESDPTPVPAAEEPSAPLAIEGRYVIRYYDGISGDRNFGILDVVEQRFADYDYVAYDDEPKEALENLLAGTHGGPEELGWEPASDYTLSEHVVEPAPEPAPRFTLHDSTDGVHSVILDAETGLVAPFYRGGGRGALAALTSGDGVLSRPEDWGWAPAASFPVGAAVAA